MRKTGSTPPWSTSSLERAADQTPAELATLARHLGNCNRSRGRLLRVRTALDEVDDLARPRFAWTLVVAGLVAGLAAAVTWAVL